MSSSAMLSLRRPYERNVEPNSRARSPTAGMRHNARIWDGTGHARGTTSATQGPSTGHNKRKAGGGPMTYIAQPTRLPGPKLSRWHFRKSAGLRM